MQDNINVEAENEALKADLEDITSANKYLARRAHLEAVAHQQLMRYQLAVAELHHHQNMSYHQYAELTKKATND